MTRRLSPGEDARDMTDTTTEADAMRGGISGLGKAPADLLPLRTVLRWIARRDAHDIATVVLLVALTIVALCTFRAYAISNDEGVQHRYGELIIAYYKSGFADQSVFHFENLYLYGGLFDMVAVALSHLIPMDPYDLRHIMCALIGIGGIGAAAATARLIAGPRAGLIAAVALAVCGAWYGAMFNHTKDIPLAAAMTGAAFFLLRIAHNLPRPRTIDLLGFGLLTGSALGMRVLGLLLVIYAALAIAMFLPRPIIGHARERWHFIAESSLRLLPALLLAYIIMIVAWPWAALAPLNPIRGLLTFSEFQYQIRTVLAGQVYEMASVPRLYVPIYILIRVPLLTLFGTALALIFALLPRLAAGSRPSWRKEIALVALTVIVPLACQVICRGPAFTGLRHFLFVIPALAILAGVGLHLGLTAIAVHHRSAAAGALAAVTAWFLWNAMTLVRLHPYEYLFYNPVIGGLEGASRRYATDYWVNIMPAAVDQLEEYLTRTESAAGPRIPRRYTVAVCGERIAFERRAKPRLLKWIRMQQWEQADFFIAPTHMNCDRILDGKVIVTIQRLGVPIGYVKDRRALSHPAIAGIP